MRRFISKARYSLVIDGNSLAAGIGDSNYVGDHPSGWALRTQQLMGSRYIIKGSGEGGQRTSWMISQWNVSDGAHPGAPGVFISGLTNILMAEEISNELRFFDGSVWTGLSVSDCLQNWAAYVSLARTAGYKVISLDILPGEAFTLYAPAESNRVICNAALATNPGKIYGDVICQASTIPQLHDYTDTTYFNPDQDHLNGTGYQLVANLMQQTLIAARYG